MSMDHGEFAVSVIIPVFNGAATIGDTLSAVLSQRVSGGRVEVIVVDNGSTDGTPDLVSRMPVRLLHESKRGPAAARNLGLRHASAPIIACVDADMLPTHRWLERLTAPLAAPEVHLVAGSVTGFQPTTPAERYAQTRGNYSRASTVDNARIPFAQGGNLAIRREEALAIGGWCEEMPSGEDVDFSIRMQKRYPSVITYVPEAMAFHRHRIDADGLQRQAHWWGRGLWHLIKRHPQFGGWSAFKSARVRAVLGWQRLCMCFATPFVRLGILSAEQAEFERYHSLWLCSYWAGFFEAHRASPGVEWSRDA